MDENAMINDAHLNFFAVAYYEFPLAYCLQDVLQEDSIYNNSRTRYAPTNY